jgi:glutamyl-tRNA synthetase
MRMEDLDDHRSKPEFETAALRDLEWLGLDWDGKVTRQSENTDRYRAAFEDLAARKLIYPCVCSRRDIRAALSAPQQGAPGPGYYPGTCRGKYADVAAAESASGKSAGLRFIATPGSVEFVDQLHGTPSFDVSETVGDFMVGRRDHSPAYQLAVVVDDAADGVTEIIRADDLLESTSQQILLQDALGLPRPTWWHLPLVVDEDGTRLAKRADSLSIAEIRERGADPRCVLSWAARSVGLSVRDRPAASELLDAFDLSSISLKPTRFTADDLEHLINSPG